MAVAFAWAVLSNINTRGIPLYMRQGFVIEIARLFGLMAMVAILGLEAAGDTANGTGTIGAVIQSDNRGELAPQGSNASGVVIIYPVDIRHDNIAISSIKFLLLICDYSVLWL